MPERVCRNEEEMSKFSEEIMFKTLLKEAQSGGAAELTRRRYCIYELGRRKFQEGNLDQQ